VKFAEVAEATKLGEQQFFTTMAPPKQGEPSQTARQPEVTRAHHNHREANNNHLSLQKSSMWMKSHHLIQHQEAPHPLWRKPNRQHQWAWTLICQKGGQGQQNEDAGNQVQPENPEEAPRVNGTTPNQEEMTVPKNHRQPCQNNHRREQWKMSLADQRSMQKNEQWRLEPRVSHHSERTSKHGT
jgi:hypothetical protein